MGSKKTLWITGAQGFVGAELCRYFRTWGYNVIGTDQEVSVCRVDELVSFASRVKPQVIINCAGIRRDEADLCNRIKAYDVNALGARNLAVVASQCNALLVQVSSDDVYATTLAHGVDELDTPHPDTPYGKSKRAGETMVRTITDNHIIIRSSWLYSASGRTLKDILQAAVAGETLGLRTDHIAAPMSFLTYACTLRNMIEHRWRGTYHVATSGSVSRYGFAACVLKFAGFDPACVLKPLSDATTAQYLVLKSVRLREQGLELPSWNDDLKAYLQSQHLLASPMRVSFQNHDKATCISLVG